MDEERPFLDELLDVAVYAPVGLALTVLEDLPGLIDKGRRRIAGQVGAAKLVGRFALRGARRRLDDLLEPSGTDATVTVLHQQEPPSAPEPVSPVADSASAEGLAIPGYDALAASQVVARLEALAPEELAAVEAYELADASAEDDPQPHHPAPRLTAMGEGTALALAVPLAADGAAVAEPLWQEALRTLGALRGGASLLRQLPEGSGSSVDSVLDETKGQLFLGSYDDVACGIAYAAVPTVTSRATLLLLYVEEAFRGVGVGESLVEAAEHWAAAAGHGALDVAVPPACVRPRSSSKGAAISADLLLLSRGEQP